MRIAILCSARTGSTSIFHLLQDHLSVGRKYTCVSEPFNNLWRNRINLPTYSVDFFKDEENVMIKTFVSKFQIPEEFMESPNSYWDWFFSYFDKVIILDRKDKTLQSESLAYHIKKDDISSWQRRQHYNMSIVKDDDLKNSLETLINESKILHDFSNRGYPIFYYENIFIEKKRDDMERMFEYLEIPLNERILETYVISEKYRIRITDEEVKARKII